MSTCKAEVVLAVAALPMGLASFLAFRRLSASAVHQRPRLSRAALTVNLASFFSLALRSFFFFLDNLQYKLSQAVVAFFPSAGRGKSQKNLQLTGGNGQHESATVSRMCGEEHLEYNISALPSLCVFAGGAAAADV